MNIDHVERVWGVEVRQGRQVVFKLGGLNDLEGSLYLHTPLCRELGLMPNVGTITDLAELPSDRWPRLRFSLETVAELPEFPQVDDGLNQKFPISMYVASLSLRPVGQLVLMTGGTGGTVSLSFVPTVRLVLKPTSELVAEVQGFQLRGGFLLHRIEAVPAEAGRG